MNQLLIATYNQGKYREIKALLDGLDLILLTPDNLRLTLIVEEDGETYAENASKKAVAFERASGLTTLGDDSGLEVELLGGKPGIHSHRFSPLQNATDADRRKYLLEILHNKPRPWIAHFKANVAVAFSSGKVILTTGQCDGEIIPEERGNNGFGYDPIFFINDFGRTMAELTMAEKNQISHRAQAIKKIIPVLFNEIR